MQHKSILACLLLSCGLAHPALAAAPTADFFGLSTGMILPAYPGCMHDAPDSLRPAGICTDTPATQPKLSLNLERLHNSDSVEFYYFEPEADVVIGPDRKIEWLELHPHSNDHTNILKILTQRYGTPEMSGQKIGSWGGVEFDGTGEAVDQAYSWKAGDVAILYRPYKSSAEYEEGVLTYKTALGDRLAQQQPAVTAPPTLEGSVNSLTMPVDKAGCLDGICVNQPAASLPASYPWMTPKDLRDLEKELAAIPEPHDFFYDNAKKDVAEARAMTKSVYVAPDDVINTIARVGHQPDAGTQEGVFVPFSFVSLLAKVKAACKPLVWELRYTSKSGYPTRVLIAWGPTDKVGGQRFRVEKIIRQYADADTPEKQYALKSKLEQSIGIKMTSLASIGDTAPVASMSGNELTIAAPMTLDYDDSANLLTHNRACQKEINVN